MTCRMRRETVVDLTDRDDDDLLFSWIRIWRRLVKTPCYPARERLARQAGAIESELILRGMTEEDFDELAAMEEER